MATKVVELPLSAEQRRWYESACARLSINRLRDNLVDLVSIPSPTGAERHASEYLASYMRRHLGGGGFYQPIDEHTGNAFGLLRGNGVGAALMLYAPLDTHLDGQAERDLPWAGPALRRDMVPKGVAEGEFVYGLGADNPKGMVATLVEVAAALFDAQVPLQGDLYAAFAGGGMPVSISDRRNYGMSDGLYHLLTRGVAPDFAVIMKPFWAVYAEEPGMCWFKVSVHGTLDYSGVPRGTPGFRSSIVPAAAVIQEIEAWIPSYIARNSSGSISTEGKIAAVRAGWPDKPAFPSAVTEIYLDLRCHPRTTPAEVKAQFAEAMAGIRKRHPEIELGWEMFGSYPGGATDPQNWIVQSAYRGWERAEGRPHPEPPPLGGQTDGTMIRRLGIPCARIGYPWPPENLPPEYKQGLGGAGVAYLPALLKSARAILYVVIDTLTRSRAEVGL